MYVCMCVSRRCWRSPRTPSPSTTTGTACSPFWPKMDTSGAFTTCSRSSGQAIATAYGLHDRCMYVFMCMKCIWSISGREFEPNLTWHRSCAQQGAKSVSGSGADGVCGQRRTQSPGLGCRLWRRQLDRVSHSERCSS